MVTAVIVFPVLVTGGIEKVEALSADQIMQQLQMPDADGAAEATDPSKDDAAKPAAGEEPVDPMKAMMDDAKKDGAK